MHSLERLLRPRSIAVFGGAQAAQVVTQSLKMGFSGEIWPVHPTKDEVAGVRAHRTVADLPAAPDAAFVGVNRHLTIGIVRELAGRGAGGAICYASGFLESGADGGGANLQAELVAAAGKMPVIGPNCYGLINYSDGALLWPDQHGGRRLAEGERGVAIVTQSSNIACNLTMQRRGLPIAFLVTAGNQAQTGLSEIALSLIEDSRVSALGLHIEGFDSVAGFENLAARARALNKPIVAMKAGRSEQARATTISHTASLAGSEAAAGAFLERLGIARVNSIPSFLETLKLLHVAGPLTGRRLSSMSCSGGEASLMADSAEGRRVHFPALASEHEALVKETLGPLVTIANPLDYHTFIWNNEAAMATAFTAFISGGFDLNMLVLDFPRSDRCSDADWQPAVNAFETALAANGAPGAVVASMPENLPEDYAESLVTRGVAPLFGIAEAMDAAEAAVLIGEAWAAPFPSPLRGGSSRRPGVGSPATALEAPPHRFASRTTSPQREEEPLVAKGGSLGEFVSSPLWGEVARAKPETVRGPSPLNEASAKSLLAQAGLPVPEGRRAANPDEAAAAAEALGFPIVLKALGIAHKSELGAVRLNLRNAEAVRAAAEDLAPLGAGLYVERMISGAVAELIVGITRDPLFGPVMTVGSGGVLVELLQDSATLLLPSTRDNVEAALRSLKMFPLLTGYRGRPKADLDAAIETIRGIAEFAIEHAENIEELDLNPLIVRTEGEGAWIADALMIVRQQAEPPYLLPLWEKVAERSEVG